MNQEIIFTVKVVADRPLGTDEFSGAQTVVNAINAVLSDNHADAERCYHAQLEDVEPDADIYIGEIHS